ncbi:MAG: TerC family protein [Peptococcaceae bacterium]|nr:TerC family protein [Peptococcaceae bacterium]
MILAGMSPQEFAAGLMTICVVNLVLSGDNAVVIAMASRNLPPEQRKKAILFGSAFAIILRILLTLVAVALLAIPFLRAIGGLLLIWIGIKLLIEEEHEEEMEGNSGLMAAIKTIVIADLVMSLDNVLAVAAASKGNITLLIIGLALSIPIIIFGSQLLVWVMHKFPAFVYIGAGLIAWTAGELINGDNKIAPLIYNYAGHYEELATMLHLKFDNKLESALAVEEAAKEALMTHFNFGTVAELEAWNASHSVLNVPVSLEWVLPAAITVFVCGWGFYVRRKRSAAA